MIRLVVMIVFALSVLIAPSAVREARSQESPAACALCSGTKVFACPTCSGKGKGMLPCELCDGTGKFACPWKREKSAESDDASLFDGVLSKFSLTHEGTQAACPNRLCERGKVTWDDGKSYSCRLCTSRGTIPCASCKESSRACGGCAGKKAVEQSCRDCAGDGSFPCPGCRTDDPACIHCGGDYRLTCGRCKGTRSSPGPCVECRGWGTVVCVECDGLTKLACGSCAGSARARSRYIDNTTAASTKCPTCGEKGVVPCGCTKGRQPCSTCNGTARSTGTCSGCDWPGEVACRSCGMYGHRLPELAGGRFAKLGKPVEACTQFDEALARANRGLTHWTEELKQLQKARPKSKPLPKLPDSGSAEKFLELLREHMEAQAAERAAADEKEGPIADLLVKLEGDIGRIRAARAKVAPPKTSTTPTPAK